MHVPSAGVFKFCYKISSVLVILGGSRVGGGGEKGCFFGIAIGNPPDGESQR